MLPRAITGPGMVAVGGKARRVRKRKANLGCYIPRVCLIKKGNTHYHRTGLVVAEEQ